MRKVSFFIVLLGAAVLVNCSGDTGPANQTGGTGTPGGSNSVGHEAVTAFTNLSEAQCTKVRGLRLFFQHASVGGNLVDGLADLAAQDAARYGITTQTFGDDALGALATWLGTHEGLGDFYLGNPSWGEKIASFTNAFKSGGLDGVADVAMMKFCYIDPDASFAAYRDAMLALEAAFPETTFIWWTMPIQGTGMADRDAFNLAVRNYARDNGKYLYDIADIECHDPSGNRLTDANGERLCPQYSTDSGHLDDAANLGRQRAAKALWVLLARIAD